MNNYTVNYMTSGMNITGQTTPYSNEITDEMNRKAIFFLFPPSKSGQVEKLVPDLTLQNKSQDVFFFVEVSIVNTGRFVRKHKDNMKIFSALRAIVKQKAMNYHHLKSNIPPSSYRTFAMAHGGETIHFYTMEPVFHQIIQVSSKR